MREIEGDLETKDAHPEVVVYFLADAGRVLVIEGGCL